MREKHLAKLIASVVVSSIFLTGCGGDATEQAVAVQNEENNSDITGIHVTDGAKYQFQVIDPEDIVIEYSGLKPDRSLADYKGKYVTDTSVYLSNQVGVYLGEDHYTATVGEYVQYTDINWKWDSNINWDMFVSTRNGVTEGDASMFEGIIDYADGTQSSVTADSVELGFEDNGNTEVVSIKFRDDTYTYKFAIPEAWWDEGDGSDMSAEDLETLKLQGTTSNSSKADHSNWRIEVVDVSNEDFDTQFQTMWNIYKLWRESVSVEEGSYLTPREITNEDTLISYTIPEDSEWYYVYGNTSIQEVYKAFGLDFGGNFVRCSHFTYTDSLNGKYGMSGGIGLSESIKSWIPISQHKQSEFSNEEKAKWLLYTYAYMYNKTGYESFFTDPYVQKFLGIDAQAITDRFLAAEGSDYLTFENVISQYMVAKEHHGYTKTFLDWVNESNDFLLNFEVDECYRVSEEEYNWQNIPQGVADFLTSHGKSLPEGTTIAEQ